MPWEAWALTYNGTSIHSYAEGTNVDTPAAASTSVSAGGGVTWIGHGPDGLKISIEYQRLNSSNEWTASTEGDPSGRGRTLGPAKRHPLPLSRRKPAG